MKLLIVDPHVTFRSPTMRGWVTAFPAFRDLFSEVQIWASECDLAEGNGVIWKRIPKRLPTWTLHAMDYQQRVNRMARQMRDSGETLVQITGCMLPVADIRYLQFWHTALLEEHALRKSTFPLPLAKRLPSRLAARTEASAVRNSRPADSWWVVSRSLAARIQKSGAAGHFDTLPNQYDPGRFNAAVRGEWRERMRAEHGISPDENVLAFSAFGHFERKGLRQAVEAVDKLRGQGHAIRLLVLGGTPETVERFVNPLTSLQRAACIFAGLVDHIERHLSTADGFLFPSHFEAFSLAEIEAAALGLRLYLTPHYGSEMILREPENGRLLPWDSSGMAAVIAKDLESGTLGETHGTLAEAMTAASYGERLRFLYQEAISRKQGSPNPY